MFGGYNMFDNLPSTFTTQYRCYSVMMLAGNERNDVDKGGKIILPPSALDLLTRLNIVYPMLFKLTNARQKRSTHCGVLEFVADEGKCYIPNWMMQNLYLSEGDFVNIQSASLPVATFARFQPQSTCFLEITDQRAVLESDLRSFACLTKGDMLAIKYNNKVYELLVLETKPDDAVSIIECDMQVDFAPPVGYTEPERPPKKDEVVEEPSLEGIPEQYIDRGQTNAFPGRGNRLDGKKKKKEVDATSPSKPVLIKKGVPDLNYTIGTLTFKRQIIKPVNEDADKEESSFEAFQCEGNTLRKKR